jgi:hypothetical protein
MFVDGVIGYAQHASATRVSTYATASEPSMMAGRPGYPGFAALFTLLRFAAGARPRM